MHDESTVLDPQVAAAVVGVGVGLVRSGVRSPPQATISFRDRSRRANPVNRYCPNSDDTLTLASLRGWNTAEEIGGGNERAVGLERAGSWRRSGRLQPL